jgi:hypothetical protein
VERNGNQQRAGQDVGREMIEADNGLPEPKQAEENGKAVEGKKCLLLHAWTTPRNRREVCVTCSSNSGDSRVSAVRGQGRSMGISWATRPG